MKLNRKDFFKTLLFGVASQGVTPKPLAVEQFELSEQGPIDVRFMMPSNPIFLPKNPAFPHISDVHDPWNNPL